MTQEDAAQPSGRRRRLRDAQREASAENGCDQQIKALGHITQTQRRWAANRQPVPVPQSLRVDGGMTRHIGDDILCFRHDAR